MEGTSGVGWAGAEGGLSWQGPQQWWWVQGFAASISGPWVGVMAVGDQPGVSEQKPQSLCKGAGGDVCLCPPSPESLPSSCFSDMQSALSCPASRLMKD